MAAAMAAWGGGGNGAGTGGEAEEEGDEGSEDEGSEDEGSEDEGSEDPAPFSAVFPRDPALFAESFPELRRFRFCGRVLRIAQQHGPRLGMAAAVWDGALALCRFFEEQRMDFHGRSVLELGAGTGIVGILAALLGGDVTITDLAVAMDQIRDNICRNASAVVLGGGRARARALPWGHDLQAVPRGYDVVLGADVVYDPRCFPALLATLCHVCGPRSIALLSCGMRCELGTAGFFSTVLPPHFSVELLRHHRDTNVSVFRLTRHGDTDSSM